MNPTKSEVIYSFQRPHWLFKQKREFSGYLATVDAVNFARKMQEAGADVKVFAVRRLLWSNGMYATDCDMVDLHDSREALINYLLGLHDDKRTTNQGQMNTALDFMSEIAGVDDCDTDSIKDLARRVHNFILTSMQKEAVNDKQHKNSRDGTP